jgi:multiple sugar transport system ATP-binding protein
MTMGDLVAVMKKGELQQVAPPQEVYDRPANLFVAGFIGSPAMNMVEATVAQEDGALFAEFADTRLQIDDAAPGREALGRRVGDGIVLGIRPEDIEDARFLADTPSDRRLTAVVDVREAMGSEVYAHFAVDSPPVLTDDTKELAADTGTEVLEDLVEQAEEQRTRFVARLNARTRAREGETVELAVDTARVHFFDRETGHRIG